MPIDGLFKAIYSSGPQGAPVSQQSLKAPTAPGPSSPLDPGSSLFSALTEGSKPKPSPMPAVSIDPNNPIVRQLAKQFGNS